MNIAVGCPVGQMRLSTNRLKCNGRHGLITNPLRADERKGRTDTDTGCSTMMMMYIFPMVYLRRILSRLEVLLNLFEPTLAKVGT